MPREVRASDDGLAYAKVPSVPRAEGAPSPKRGCAPCKVWVRFAALWVCCGLASGVLPGQALFIKLFIDQGVSSSLCDAVHDAHQSHGHDGRDEHHRQRHGSGCKEQFLALSAVMNTAQSVAIMFLAPIGFLFDRWGAQKTGTWGAVVCCLGAVGLWGSVVGAQHGYDAYTVYAFTAGVLVCDFGSMLNSFAFMGLIWHFPGQQALILSLINSTYQVAAFLPMAVEAIMVATGAEFSWILVGYFAVCALVAWACWLLVPTQAEYYDEAKRVLGMPLPRPPHAVQPCLTLGRAWSVLRRDTRDHCVSGGAIALAIGFPILYSSLAAPYGEELFGSEEDGTRLAALYTSVNGLAGLVLAPFCGALADCFGLRPFVFMLCVILATATGTCGTAAWASQAVCATALVLFMTLFQLFISRYLLLYSPPNRIGVVQGVYILIVMLASMPESWAAMACVELMPEGPDAYRVPMYVLGGLSTAAMLACSVYFWRHPMPEVPVLLPEDEAELARNFGCGNLEEVGEVVDIPDRRELVKKLSSTDPDMLRELIQSIDTGKMLEMMARRPVEDIAAMMEEGLVGDDADDEAGAGANAASGAEVETEAAGGAGAGADAAAEGPAAAEPAADAAGAEARDADCKAPAAGAEGDGGPGRARELGERWRRLVAAGDAVGLRGLLLTEPVEDLWASVLDSEERLSAAERRRQDREFDRLVPGREFAELLRQRRELRVLVQRLMKRELDRKISALRGKKA